MIIQQVETNALKRSRVTIETSFSVFPSSRIYIINDVTKRHLLAYLSVIFIINFMQKQQTKIHTLSVFPWHRI